MKNQSNNFGVAIYLNNGHTHNYPLPEGFEMPDLEYIDLDFLKIQLNENEFLMVRIEEIDCIVVGPIVQDA